MPLKEGCFRDCLGCVEIDEREVRITARFDCASSVDAKSLCSVARSKRRDARNIEPLVDQSGQGPLNAGDAAPDLEEIVALFHFRRTGGMIGSDHIHFPIDDRCPERVAIGVAAQGRCAFRDSADAQQIVFGEEQIVRAGFNRDIRAERAGFERGRDPLAGTDVDDVQFAAGLAGEQSGAADGFDLGDDGARFEECRDVVTAGSRSSARQGVW